MTNTVTATTERLTADLRNVLGIPEGLIEAHEMPVGYLLSLTKRDADDNWLIQDLVKQGSINMCSVSNHYAGEILSVLMSHAVVNDSAFFGHKAHQGGVLSYAGAETIWTEGPVTYKPQRTIVDPTYLPFRLPIPPDCEFIKDFIRSGVKMLDWDEVYQTENWLNIRDEVPKFGYITQTDAAAIIWAESYFNSMDSAIRAFRRALTADLTLHGFRLSLTFLPGDPGCALGWHPIEDFADRLQVVANVPEPDLGPAPDLFPVDRIYWGVKETGRGHIFCDGNPIVVIEDEPPQWGPWAA
jgi:hypothetical protein